MKTSQAERVRIGMLSLGCSKTLVDSEVILGKLDPAKFKITPSAGDCDIALLNTCSFIQDAQKESVDRILELIELKNQKQIKAVVVMGCLVQKFPGELEKELKEVDAFIGSGEYSKIPEIVERVSAGEKVSRIGTPGYLSTSGEARVALTPRHYRFLKISEGCDHICSFCTIPNFRGHHRSRTIGDVVTEAEHLVRQGAKEIIVTGQDTTYFGRDQGGRYQLPDLLKRLDEVKGVEWIRLLYAYPSCVTRELMETMRDSQHICHYLDMPLQHASDPMLQAMRRGITKRRTIDLIREFRDTVADLAIRTTFIVGFPGETEKDFDELLEFMEAMRFERAGIFTYSREKDSAAYGLPGQVPEKIKQRRRDTAMKLQQKISEKNHRKLLGKSLRVLVEGRDEKNKKLWIGRSYMDAPEVDGNIFIETEKKLTVGSFYSAQIIETKAYDLLARLY